MVPSMAYALDKNLKNGTLSKSFYDDSGEVALYWPEDVRDAWIHEHWRGDEAVIGGVTDTCTPFATFATSAFDTSAYTSPAACLCSASVRWAFPLPSAFYSVLVSLPAYLSALSLYPLTSLYFTHVSIR
ncbi:hypothetical protein ColTof4_01163 [Colletotrichum tofieldiae]|nr:hypothetical protein ColTof3_08389 [Colletotrichum tofieldiae]GKT68740.1 hypothetical protein ColTof4_01163 [Colletotrichum tofieldiae]